MVQLEATRCRMPESVKQLLSDKIEPTKEAIKLYEEEIAGAKYQKKRKIWVTTS